MKPSTGFYVLVRLINHTTKFLTSQVVGNEQTLDRLKVIAEEGNMPNVIICGPPGTGKTTSVHALAHTMLGDAYSVSFAFGPLGLGIGIHVFLLC